MNISMHTNLMSNNYTFNQSIINDNTDAFIGPYDPTINTAGTYFPTTTIPHSHSTTTTAPYHYGMNIGTNIDYEYIDGIHLSLFMKLTKIFKKEMDVMTKFEKDLINNKIDDLLKRGKINIKIEIADEEKI